MSVAAVVVELSSLQHVEEKIEYNKAAFSALLWNSLVQKSYNFCCCVTCEPLFNPVFYCICVQKSTHDVWGSVGGISVSFLHKTITK